MMTEELVNEPPDQNLDELAAKRMVAVANAAKSHIKAKMETRGWQKTTEITDTSLKELAVTVNSLDDVHTLLLEERKRNIEKLTTVRR